MSEYLLYTGSRGCQPVDDLRGVDLKGGGGFFWLDIRNPSYADLRLLQERLPIHPLTIEDIQLGESREKCESYAQYLFLSVQLLDEEDFYGKLHTPKDEAAAEAGVMAGGEWPSCYMLVFAHCLISLHCIPLPFLPALLNRRLAASSRGGGSGMSGDWLAYILLDEIVDDFTRQGALLQAEVDAIEDLTLSLGHFDQLDMLRRIYAAHRRTTILTRLIQAKLEVVRSLSKSSSLVPFLLPRTLLYLRDVQDHLHSLLQQLAIFRESLDQSHDHYLGQADIELALAGHRMNITVKKITALTLMIGSAMTVSSIMGMNVRVPFERFGFPGELPPLVGLLPFLSLLGGMLLLLASVLLFGRRKRWF